MTHRNILYHTFMPTSKAKMRIAELRARPDWVLSIVADDGRIGQFDVSPYFQYEAFAPLRDQNEFNKVVNGGYFVEWDCGADLSADTIEAQWHVVGSTDVDKS